MRTLVSIVVASGVLFGLVGCHGGSTGALVQQVPVPRPESGAPSVPVEARAIAPAPARAEIGTDLVFGPGSAGFSKDGREAFDACVAELAKGSTLDVEIFRDKSPIMVNRFTGRSGLCESRLAALKPRLEAAGFKIRRMTAAGAVDRDGRRASRRIEITVVPDVVPKDPPEKEASARGRERIDLGASLFESGRATFIAGAEKRILACLSHLSPGVQFDVEVFQDPANLVHHREPHFAEKLARARGQSMRLYLESQGFSVRNVILRGPVAVRRKPPSRRVELVVVGP
jgi:hypothetical protein